MGLRAETRGHWEGVGEKEIRRLGNGCTTVTSKIPANSQSAGRRHRL